jgi:hypothetical protein
MNGYLSPDNLCFGLYFMDLRDCWEITHVLPSADSHSIDRLISAPPSFKKTLLITTQFHEAPSCDEVNSCEQERNIGGKIKDEFVQFIQRFLV